MLLCLKLFLNSGQECEKRGVSVYGAIIAAALKAVAAYKQVGARGEHYGAIVLLQCRSLLQPPLPDSAIGKHSRFHFLTKWESSSQFQAC